MFSSLDGKLLEVPVIEIFDFSTPAKILYKGS